MNKRYENTEESIMSAALFLASVLLLGLAGYFTCGSSYSEFPDLEKFVTIASFALGAIGASISIYVMIRIFKDNK